MTQKKWRRRRFSNQNFITSLETMLLEMLKSLKTRPHSNLWRRGYYLFISSGINTLFVLVSVVQSNFCTIQDTKFAINLFWCSLLKKRLAGYRLPLMPKKSKAYRRVRDTTRFIHSRRTRTVLFSRFCQSAECVHSSQNAFNTWMQMVLNTDIAYLPTIPSNLLIHL